VKILLVEDEAPIAAVIKRGLESARYSVDVADDGERGLELALTGDYSLVILDLMLPGRSGWSICEALRERRMEVPILMLTARDTVADRVRGMEIGADDYLPKPFNFAELLMRVQALLRRNHVHRTRVIRIGDLEIDTVSARVTLEGEPVSLNRAEYALLETLAANEGRVLSVETLRQRLADEPEGATGGVDLHVDRLKGKIDEGRGRELIHAVGGVGYTLHAPALLLAAC
jgi:DNA-binding response OmpR family regulator